MARDAMERGAKGEKPARMISVLARDLRE